jgi:hypothetical protein
VDETASSREIGEGKGRRRSRREEAEEGMREKVGSV